MVHGREQVARQLLVDGELLWVVCFSTGPPSFLPSPYAASTVSSASETPQKTRSLTSQTSLTGRSRLAPEKEGNNVSRTSKLKRGCEYKTHL